MRNNKLFKIVGFIVLTVSCILFLFIPVVPWLGFSGGQTAGIAAGLLISGEILFYLSLFILGRGFYDKIKNKFNSWRSKTKRSNLPAGGKP